MEVLHFFLLLVEVDFEFLVSVEVPHKLNENKEDQYIGGALSLISR